MEVNAILYSFIFLLFKCGVTLVFLSLFIIHIDLFHIQLFASSYGICNIVSRIFTLGAPIVAEFEERLIPLLIMMVMNVLALIANYFLKMRNKGENYSNS